MRVIITGGSGLIGRALSENLAADGHTVTILSRSPERPAGLPEGVEVARWDARTADGWGHLAEGADAIVNLAGSNLAGEGFFPSRWTADRKQVIRDSRVWAGQAVVEAAEAAKEKPGVVIQASGVGYYGNTGDREITEDAPPGADYLADLAANEWEPSTAAVEEMGVRRAIARSGAVLDAQEGALPRLLLPHRLFVGGPMGSGKQWLPWIHLQDEARAIRFLIENETASGPFNLVAPEPITNAAFGKAIGRVLGRPSLIPVPGFAMKTAFGDVSSVVLEGQRAVPQRLLEMGFTFRFPKAKAALEDLLT
jgi:uncharacterized protein (TIGR01777 family)